MHRLFRTGDLRWSAPSPNALGLVKIATVVLLITALVVVLGPGAAVANNGKGGGKGGGGGGGWEPPPPTPFADCGTLIQGVECWLFDSDNFGVYVVEGLIGHGGGPVVPLSGGGDDGFQPGDRIYVEGLLDPFCLTFCQQGDGCISSPTVTKCPEEAIGGDARYTVYDLLSMLDSWGPCMNKTRCRWDLTGDGWTGVDDLLSLLDSME